MNSSPFSPRLLWWVVFAVLVAAVFVPVSDASAQTYSAIGGTGGGGNLGLFSSIWTYFKANFVQGIILLGVVGVGVTLIMLRFQIMSVAMICAGCVVLANAVAIATGAISLGAG